MKNSASERGPRTGLTTGRLETLSDGVLAIAITLLVLGFADKPAFIAQGTSEEEVRQRLFDLWPQILAYVLSFVLTSIYWILHHLMFHYIVRADRLLLWLNIAFLAGVALIPFPTALLAAGFYHEHNVVVVFYGLIHLGTGLCLAALWWYATHCEHLVAEHLDPHMARTIWHAILLGPAFYALGIGLSYAHQRAGVLVFLLIPLLYLLPTRVGGHWAPIIHRLTLSRHASGET